MWKFYWDSRDHLLLNPYRSHNFDFMSIVRHSMFSERVPLYYTLCESRFSSLGALSPSGVFYRSCAAWRDSGKNWGCLHVSQMYSDCITNMNATWWEEKRSRGLFNMCMSWMESKPCKSLNSDIWRDRVSQYGGPCFILQGLTFPIRSGCIKAYKKENSWHYFP